MYWLVSLDIEKEVEVYILWENDWVMLENKVYVRKVVNWSIVIDKS